MLHLRRLLDTYPDHATTPAAVFYLGRTLVTVKRPREAVPVLRQFKEKHADHRLMPEARFYYARALLDAGDEAEGTAEMRAFVAAYPGHELASQAQRAVTGSVVRGSSKGDLGDEYKRLMSATPASAENLYDAAVAPRGPAGPRTRRRPGRACEKSSRITRWRSAPRSISPRWRSRGASTRMR